MDPKYTTEILEHLEKQNDCLMDAYRSMSYELHKLQVEEEMLMRKFYDFMKSEHQPTENDDNEKESGESNKSKSKSEEVDCEQK